MRRRLGWLGAAFVLAAGLLSVVFCSGTGFHGLRPAAAGETVAWPTITWTAVVTGLTRPVHVTHAGDRSGRLFVVEKAGRILIAQDGVLSPTPFLSIQGRVGSEGTEQGLLSLAFPPGDGDKSTFYVNYTDRNGKTVVARYRVTADPDVADPDSEEVILTQTQPYQNHNGGQLAFGPDGYLYIGMGDGGGGGDPAGNAQDPTSLLGKMLRIDVGDAALPGPGITPTHVAYLPLVLGEDSSPYTVPASNPYTQTEGYRGEIWALGLRNPWRFSFDDATGDLYVGDVGQNRYEEVNVQPAASGGGENYGWNIMEGMHCYPGPPCDQTGLVLPVVEYDSTRDDCSVTGGMVYRGTDNPGMEGIYFYGDYCTGRIWGLVREDEAWQESELADTDLTITSFGEDEAGNLYVTDFWGGAVYEIVEVP